MPQQYYDENGKPLKDDKYTPQPQVAVPQGGPPTGIQYYDERGQPLGLGIPTVTNPTAPSEPIGDFVKRKAPVLGRALAEVPPFAGSFLPGLLKYPGVAAGTAVKHSVQRDNPEFFGKPPDTPDDTFWDYLKDITFNAVVPSAAGRMTDEAAKIYGIGKQAYGLSSGASLIDRARQTGRAIPPIRLKDFPAVREEQVKQLAAESDRVLGLAGKTPSQITEQGAEAAAGRYQRLQDAAEFTRQQFPPLVIRGPGGKFIRAQMSSEEKAVRELLTDEFGPNQVGNMLRQLDKEVKAGQDVAGSQTYGAIQGAVLGDLRHLRNAKIVAGERFPRELAIDELLTAGKTGSPGAESFSADAVQRMLKGNKREIYQEALGPSYAPVEKFVDNIAELQKGGKPLDTVISYRDGRLVWGAAIGLEMAGLKGSARVLAATKAGATLTNYGLRRLMSDPKTASIVNAALKTPVSSPFSQQANYALQRAIAGISDAATLPEE